MSSFTLVSDVGGSIEQIALQIDPRILAGVETRIAYEELVRALADKELVAVTAASAQVCVSAWLKGLGVARFTVIAINDTEFIASCVWPRDAVLNAVAQPTGTVLHVLPEVSRTGMFRDWLSQHLHIPNQSVSISLDGGDSIVIGSARWLVGAGAVGRTKDTRRLDWSGAVAHIHQQVGRKPTIAGYRYSDIENKMRWLRERFAVHADRIPRPAADATIVARLTARVSANVTAVRRTVADIISDELHTDWLHVDMVVSATGETEGGKPLVFVASTKMEGCPRTSEGDYKDDLLTALAKELERKDMAVRRNPAPCVDAVVFPYNNTILQRDPNIVWLPVFTTQHENYSVADAANVELWTSMGYEVRQVKGWRRFAEADGSIRCATLPLRRA